MEPIGALLYKESGPFLAKNWAWISCAVSVSWSAYSRFNTPQLYRASTTRGRYHIALHTYWMSWMLGFLVLSYLLLVTPDIMDSVFHTEAIRSFFDKLGLQHAAVPLATWFVVSVLVERTALAHVDRWLLRVLREQANIPHEVRELGNRLSRSTTTISAEAGAALGRKVDEDTKLQHFQAKDLRFADDGSLYHAFTRCFYLMHELDRLRETGKFQRSLGRIVEFNSAWNSLLADFEVLKTEADIFTRVAQEEKPEELVSPHRAAVAEFLKGFNRDLNEMYKRLCLFIAYDLLYCHDTRNERQQRLKELGFDNGVAKHRGLDVHGWTLVALLLIVCLISLNIALGLVGMGNLPILFMLLPIYFISVFIAVWPKGRLSIATRQAGQLPYFGYLASAMVAYCVSIGIAFVFRTWIEGVDGGVHNLPLSLRYAIMSFCFTFAMAFCIDWQPPQGAEQKYFSLLHAGFGLVVMSVASVFVYYLLPEVAKPAVTWKFRPLWVNAGVACIFFYWIPRICRVAMRERATSSVFEEKAITL